jgi:hypothetical protein
VSGGDPVEPAAKAEERGGGPVDVTDPEQQAPPAAQRPGGGQMPDGLLHQRTQPCLATVVGAFRLGEPIDGAAVADGGVPGRAGLGQAAKAPVDEGDDLGGVQGLADPRQGEQLVFVAAARPAAVAVQQVAMDGGDRDALGGVGVALGVIEDLLVAQDRGRGTRVASPSTTTASPAAAISASGVASVARSVTKVPSGWQMPRPARVPSSRSRLSPTSVLQIPTMRAARR